MHAASRSRSPAAPLAFCRSLPAIRQSSREHGAFLLSLCYAGVHVGIYWQRPRCLFACPDTGIQCTRKMYLWLMLALSCYSHRHKG